MSTIADLRSAQKSLEHARKGDFQRSLAELHLIIEPSDRNKTAIEVAELALAMLEPIAVEMAIEYIISPKERGDLSLRAGRIQINRRDLPDACCIVGL